VRDYAEALAEQAHRLVDNLETIESDLADIKVLSEEGGADA
jgi:hypothetical protein